MPDDILEYWMSLSRQLAKRFNTEQFDTSSAMWSWVNFSEDIRSLRNRLGVAGEHVDVLGLRLDFKTGETTDLLTDGLTSSSRIIPPLFYYSKAQDVGLAQKWVKFNSLRGSWACRFSFNEQQLNALASAYVHGRDGLLKALDRLGAIRTDYGDAAFEVSFLPRVKVLLIFEDADEEFPASVRLLYDRNSIFYLPHEMLGEISWFVSRRATKAIGS